MWLRSVYLKTLRDHRVGALAWGLGPGALMVAVLTQFQQIVGDAHARAALVAVAEQFSWYEAPVGILRPGGFATFRLGPMLAILPSVWALLAATRTMRGEEERRMLDLVLAAPLSRAQVVMQKLAALATALAVMGGVLGVLVWIAGRAADAEYGAVEALVFGLNVALTAATFGAIALLVSQFVAERSAAAGITGALLALSFVLHSTARISPDLKWLAYLSPLYYAGLTKPLVPEVGISPGGMAALSAITLLAAGAAAALFTQRDLGASLHLPLPALTWLGGPGDHAPAAYAPRGDWSLRAILLRDLRSIGRSAVWWAAGAVAYAAWMTAAAVTIQANFTTMARGSPLLSAIFSRLTGVEGTAVFLNMVVFSFVPLIISAFSVSEAARWAVDEEEGRTEMILAAPVSRRHVVLARFAAIGAVLTAICAAVAVGVLGAGRAVGLELNTANLAAAALGIVPVALLVACLGALLSGWLRSAVVSSLLMVYVVVSFILVFIGPIFHWPRALIGLSIYEAYGSPLVDGWSWPGMSTLCGLAALLLAAATVRFARKDLAR
ncbi:MAG TPA: ABC transporter permease subunit [Chloroflexota bacterium]|nr:ABC transporter permease subunit [Chloroflexota bacterium]